MISIVHMFYVFVHVFDRLCMSVSVFTMSIYDQFYQQITPLKRVLSFYFKESSQQSYFESDFGWLGLLVYWW